MVAAPTIDDYLARQPPHTRRILQRVRTILRKSVPGTEEVISYQIPALRLGGRVMIFFAGWKQHYSVYPATDGLLEAFADELAPYSVSKGTIRFPLDGPMPVHLLAKIAKFRAKETLARNEAAAVRKAAKKPKPSAKETAAAKKPKPSAKETVAAKKPKPSARKPTSSAKKPTASAKKPTSSAKNVWARV